MAIYAIVEVKVTDDSWIPDYAQYGDARRAGSESHFHVIDSTDVAGTIPYLASNT